MDLEYLEFEQPIQEIEQKIDSIKAVNNATSSVNTANVLQELIEQRDKKIEQIFSSLTDWQITQIARHPNRPKSSYYIDNVFDKFIELHGDRLAKDDRAITAGLGKINDKSFVFIGQEKGNSIYEKIEVNFGMPKPEGYRKAKRMMLMAERFKLPLITFIDTPGAYPGIDAEKNGQSQSIAEDIYILSGLKTPIISVIIGEGGSGGALALAVADYLMMFEYSFYSVISPEGCASILYKDKSKIQQAAESLKLTSDFLLKNNIIDKVIKEPLGGIHRDRVYGADVLKESLLKSLEHFNKIPINDLIKNRQDKISNVGNINKKHEKSFFID